MQNHDPPKPHILKEALYENMIFVVSIGRLVDYKSFETAINAFQYLPINFRLKIIGSGKLRNKLNLLIN